MPDIQYWLPRGHNNWVGDVVTIYFGGRYHLFYLYDRRHHRSKFGRGGHYFAHLSTADFTTWIEHEAAAPIAEQWETLGTGSPFAWHGRLHLSYGLHTSRIYPPEKTMLPVQWKYLEEHGRTGAFQRGTTPGFPEGATYSVCTDGIAKFMRSDIIFHPCENPGVYTDAEGKLRLLASYGSRGTWESETLDGGWCCSNPDFPPGGDCTFFFHWGEFDYIIGGFTGLWMKSSDAPVSAYEDMVRHGLDFYDGSNVPAVTEIAGGRFLMAAWISIRGWGGNLLIRELLQLPDGRIGSKWMDEITPKAGKSMLLGKALSGTTSFPVEHRACMLVFEVHPRRQGKAGSHLCSFPKQEMSTRASCKYGRVTNARSSLPVHVMASHPMSSRSAKAAPRSTPAITPSSSSSAPAGRSPCASW